MALLSSDTLFHFTNAKEHLLGILEFEFEARLSVESFEHIANHLPPSEFMRESGVAMVCFCDIPLSQVSGHMRHYGHYGLGLKKSWGMKSGVAPVMYVHEKAQGPESAADLIRLIEVLHKEGARSEVTLAALELGRFVYYLKPYRGTMIRPDATVQDVCFYDEREWRYVPRQVEWIPAISREDLADPVKSAPARILTKRLPRLSFDPWDINYIIVATEDEVLPMFYAVDALKAKYDQAQKDLLKTKIVSAERILKDF